MTRRILIVIFSTITLVLLTAFGTYYYLNQKMKADQDPDIDQVLSMSSDMPEVITNLGSGDIVRISFKVQTDNKDTKVEFEKRSFQANNIIIKHLSNLDADDIASTEGKIQLEEDLKRKLNAILTDGKIENIYITSIIIQ